MAKDTFLVAAQAIIEQFVSAKMPHHSINSYNQAHLETGTYEQIMLQLEWDLELNGLETPDEMQINTVMQQTTKPKTWENRSHMSSLRKAEPLAEPVSSVQEKGRPEWHQQKECQLQQ